MGEAMPQDPLKYDFRPIDVETNQANKKLVLEFFKAFEGCGGKRFRKCAQRICKPGLRMARRLSL